MKEIGKRTRKATPGVLRQLRLLNLEGKKMRL
jgi:hypothetical protein